MNDAYTGCDLPNLDHNNDEVRKLQYGFFLKKISFQLMFYFYAVLT